MGINGLWDLLGEGQIISIAQYASDHFKRHGRHLRVAVDEAGWRFNNLTDAQVAAIRETQEAANPIEKTILWRILWLMRLNIQLLFVFDGPRRPWKRGRRGGGRLDYGRINPLEELLDRLAVPHHRAPAEAEAECARLQKLGVVDAVWSDDGDTLMFGAETLIRQHKVGNKRMEGMIRVYTSGEILREHGIDRYGLVLFVTLCGGDYDTKGLPGCGPSKARLLAKQSSNLGRSLCLAREEDLPAWRECLSQSLQRYRCDVFVTAAFPNWRALRHYRNPRVSTDYQLSTLRGLRKGWDVPFDQQNLRVLLRQRFDIWSRGFLKHITPILLVRTLVKTAPGQEASNNCFDIKIKTTRQKKDDNGEAIPDDKTEKKITFNPAELVQIDTSQCPPDEDWSIWTDKHDAPFDPGARIEAEIPTCVLAHGLLPGWEEVTEEPKTRNRKARGVAQGREVEAAPKRERRTTSYYEEPTITHPSSQTALKKRKESPEVTVDTGEGTSKTHKRAKQSHATKPVGPEVVDILDSETDSGPSAALVASQDGFKLPSSKQKSSPKLSITARQAIERERRQAEAGVSVRDFGSSLPGPIPRDISVQITETPSQGAGRNPSAVGHPEKTAPEQSRARPEPSATGTVPWALDKLSPPHPSVRTHTDSTTAHKPASEVLQPLPTSSYEPKGVNFRALERERRERRLATEMARSCGAAPPAHLESRGAAALIIDLT